MKYTIATGICGILSLFIAAESASAQGLMNEVPYEEKREIVTEDGWKLAATYYNIRSTEPEAGAQRSVVLLLPNDRGNRLNWEGQTGAAVKLRDNGYAVITLDPRKYGESQPPPNLRDPVKELRPLDYANILRYDLEAVKQFLFEEHQQKNLNMAKFAIVAPESLAPVAMGFTVRDWKKVPYQDAATLSTRTPRGQDVKALVLISPEVNLPQISGKSALLQLRQPAFDVAICTMTGAEDEAGMEASDLIHTYLTGNKEPASEDARMFYKQVYPKFGDRGTALIGRNDQLSADMLKFLNRHVMSKTIPWQDRRSRFER